MSAKLKKIPVGVLGATGAVGQRFIQLLENHPWFQVAAVAASDRSAGQPYAQICHWLLPTPMPEEVRDLIVQPIEPRLDCRLVFSSLPADVAGPIEEVFARAGYAVCSNAASHRLDADVPLLIPEVNHTHTPLIEIQRQRRGWTGLIAASANCTTTELVVALRPLHDAFVIRKLNVVTMQAISGAGYPGVPSLDILGNVIPFVGGEEDKVENESRKLLGAFQNNEIAHASFVVSAQCNRVPVQDGHIECVSVELAHKPTLEEMIAAFEGFHVSQVADLPSSPAQPIIVHTAADRPQPARDRDLGKGMAVSVGRVRPCPLFDYKFVVLGHNTVRGAAGGSIHNAELLVSQGHIA